MKESPTLRIPGEWEPHAACWLAFPHLESEWPASHLQNAQRSIAELSREIGNDGGEPVHLLTPDGKQQKFARTMIGPNANVDYIITNYSYCWTRDTLPLLGRTTDGAIGSLEWRFNGWGNRFNSLDTQELQTWFAEYLNLQRSWSSLALEGGALEFNGAGTCITTAACVLNNNRNPRLTRDEFEAELAQMVICDRVIWLEEGLINDHTDGHADMLARFIGPETVLCMRPAAKDPNQNTLRQIEETLRTAGLKVQTLPSPGTVYSPDHQLLPATYCNFYIANEAVFVPVYGIDQDREALAVLQDAFPTRRVSAFDATDLLIGGGIFHCVTQPQPALP